MSTLFHRPGLTPLLTGVVLAAGLHVQQRALPSSEACWVSLALSLLTAGTLWRYHRQTCKSSPATGVSLRTWLLACLCAAWLAWSWMNVHALWRHPMVTAPTWEGLTLRLHGVVSDLPQQHEDSWRFRFEVEAAWREDTGESLAVPQRVLLGWYGRGMASETGLPLSLRAGERWAL